jgi:hypothetical protein
MNFTGTRTVTGCIDPTLEGTELQSASEDLGAKFKALFGKVSPTFPPPTERALGKIAVADDL